MAGRRVVGAGGALFGPMPACEHPERPADDRTVYHLPNADGPCTGCVRVYDLHTTLGSTDPVLTGIRDQLTQPTPDR